MDGHGLVPFALFACITYAFKALLDAIMRDRMLREPGTKDLLLSILQGEEAQRRLNSLRWGLLFTFVAIAFAIIEAMRWHDITPGVIAILAAATGLAHLTFYWLSRRLS